MAQATQTLPRPVTIRQGWGYWDLTRHPRGGEFRRLTADTTLTIDAEHAGELYGKLPDGRRPSEHGGVDHVPGLLAVVALFDDSGIRSPVHYCDRAFVAFATGDVKLALIAHEEVRIGLVGAGEITAADH